MLERVGVGQDDGNAVVCDLEEGIERCIAHLLQVKTRAVGTEMVHVAVRKWDSYGACERRDRLSIIETTHDREAVGNEPEAIVVVDWLIAYSYAAARLGEQQSYTVEASDRIQSRIRQDPCLAAGNEHYDPMRPFLDLLGISGRKVSGRQEALIYRVTWVADPELVR